MKTTSKPKVRTAEQVRNEQSKLSERISISDSRGQKLLRASREAQLVYFGLQAKSIAAQKRALDADLKAMAAYKKSTAQAIAGGELRDKWLVLERERKATVKREKAQK